VRIGEENAAVTRRAARPRRWTVQGHWPRDDGPIYRPAREDDANRLAATLLAAGAVRVTINPPAKRPRARTKTT
jgi:hypothetical protein